MRIAVYGASGHTGSFVVRELLRRGHVPIAIGRDGAALSGAVAKHGSHVETKVARLDSPASLERALAGAEAVIHCAGPFLDTAAPLVKAALRCRVHYFDVTAEQGSALSTLELFDAPARERGILVVPAAGFYGGLGDLLATCAMGDWASAERIEIAIALSGWWPTRGTRRTGERNTLPRLIVSDGTLVEVQPSRPVQWNFPEPFGTQNVLQAPLTETILAARHLHVREVRNYINEAPLHDLSDPATPEPIAADDRGRSNQRFVMQAVVRNGDEERHATATGRDIYAITAPIVVEAVERMCLGSQPRGGAFALGQRVDASELLHALASVGEIVLTADRKTTVSRT